MSQPHKDIRPGRKNNQLAFIAKSVIPALIRNDISWPFRKPVDVILLDIPDYLQIIKEPMDLETINMRLRTEYYNKAADCIADIELIFKNCYKYNKKTDDVCKMAKRLKMQFDSLMVTMPEYKAIKRKVGSVSSRIEKKKENIPPPQHPRRIVKIPDESESSSDGEFTDKLAACVDGFKDQLIKLLVVKKKHFRKQQHPMQLIKSSFRLASLFDQESEIPVIPETSFLITDEERDALLQLAANDNAENVDQLDLQKKGNPELSEDDEPLVKRTKVDGKFDCFSPRTSTPKSPETTKNVFVVPSNLLSLEVPILHANKIIKETSLLETSTHVTVNYNNLKYMPKYHMKDRIKDFS